MEIDFTVEFSKKFLVAPPFIQKKKKKKKIKLFRFGCKLTPQLGF